MSMPKRPHRVNNMITLGKWVAEQAALGCLDFDGVARAYIKSGQSWPTNATQISKLRVFWWYGRMHKATGVAWLANWQEHRTGKMSTYETLLDEMRAQLYSGE
jgi:hypothetical protein